MREAREIMADISAAGLTPDQLALVLELAAVLPIEARPMKDEGAERRRQKDRERSNRRNDLLPRDWWTIRREVFDRDGYRCVYCGSEHQLECDHIVPLSQGGGNDLSNLTTACKSCNSSKGAKGLAEWRGEGWRA